jgi:6-phosphogluconolactonase
VLVTTPQPPLASAPTAHRLTRRDLFPLAGAAALAATLAPARLASAQTAPSSDTAGAAAAQRRFVYVGTYTAPNTAPGGTKPSTAVGIYVFELHPATGLLSPVQVVPDIPNPSWLTLDPQQRFLYAISEVTTWNGVTNSGGVTAFAIDPTTGKLSKLNDQPTMGAIAAHDVVDPTGKDLLVANYASDPNTGASFVVLPIHTDGTLAPASDIFSPSGRGPNPDRQLSPHPHQVHFDPAGRYVFGPDLGTDKIWSWTLDTTAGKLMPNPVLPYEQVASGSGPRHMDFHPSGRFVYVIDEMVSSITAFTYDSTQGTFL